MHLVRVGYWRRADTLEWPDPSSFRDETWNKSEREDVASYLRGGLVFRTYMGFSSCRLCGRSNGAVELTDTTYVWPEGLAHYVEEHSVRLPQVFIDHINRRLDELETATVDDSWWRSQG